MGKRYFLFSFTVKSTCNWSLKKILFLTCYLDPDPYGSAFVIKVGSGAAFVKMDPDLHKVNADPTHCVLV
jgi:hypothetical protein